MARRPIQKPPFATEGVRQAVRATADRKKLADGVTTSAEEVKSPVRLSRQEREKAFVAVYCANGFIGKRAVVDCGAFPDIQESTAGTYATQLLKSPWVREAIDKYQRAWAVRYSITAERIQDELAAVAFSNMADYITVNSDGSATVDFSLIKDPVIGRRIAAAISQVESETYVDGPDGDTVKRNKFRLHSKIEALHLLGKIFQMPGLAPNAAQGNTFNVQNMQIVYHSIEQKLLETEGA